MNLYFVKDKVSNSYSMPFISATDGTAVRDALPMVCRAKLYDDFDFVRICSVQTENGFALGDLEMKIVDKENAYKFPETISKSLKANEFQARIDNYALDQGAQNRSEIDAPIK